MNEIFIMINVYANMLDLAYMDERQEGMLLLVGQHSTFGLS